MSDIIKDFPAECWIAGGSIVCSYINYEVNDIDIYFPTNKAFKDVKNFVLNNGGVKLKSTNTSFKVQYKGFTLDLVKIFYKTPKDTIKDFDFSICSAAVDKKGNLFYDSNFFIDLEEKRLRFNKKCCILADLTIILIRLNKYGVRGFTLDEKEAKKVSKFHKEKIEEGLGESYYKETNDPDKLEDENFILF